MSQTNGANGDFALSVVKDGIIHHFEIKVHVEEIILNLVISIAMWRCFFLLQEILPR